MKALFFIICFAVCQQVAYAQACSEVQLFSTAQKRTLLRDYINESYQKHHFFEDKGVVQLITYQDAKGRACWLVSALVDNRFLLSPPQQYAWLGNDVILIYQGDSQGKIIPANIPKDELRSCISELVGGRVYDYNPKPQYAYYIDNGGARKKTPVRHDSYGNVHNELIIVFNKDGSVSKLIPV